jgi:hypothetical protein
LLQTKVRCWDYWMNSKLIKVSDTVYWIVSCCFYGIKYFPMITCLLQLYRGWTVWSWQSPSDGGNCCSWRVRNNVLKLQTQLNDKLQCGILPYWIVYYNSYVSHLDATIILFRFKSFHYVILSPPALPLCKILDK